MLKYLQNYDGQKKQYCQNISILKINWTLILGRLINQITQTTNPNSVY
jgi:hypothetical protein